MSLTRKMSKASSDRARIAEYDSKYPASFSIQCKEILTRSMKSVMRRPQDFRVRVIRNLLMGLLAGGVFWDAGSGQTGPQTRLSSFFFLLIVATFNSFTQIAMIILDRPSYYRERLAGSYRALVYLLGLILPDLPIQVFCSFLFFSFLVFPPLSRSHFSLCTGLVLFALRYPPIFYGWASHRPRTSFLLFHLRFWCLRSLFLSC